jgi:HK97 family phage prohead protease
MRVKTGDVLTLDTKAVSDDGEFEGYASVWDRVDLVNDVVVKGAFAASLKARPASKVKMLFQHSMAEPIGVWTELVEDAKGLKAKGRLILETTKGREVYALMKAGALDGLSIGFKTLKDTYDRTKGIRYLQKVDLHEISVVTFGALPAATVTAVKAADQAEHARRVVAALNRAAEALRT